ncbi:MAG: Hint domain-containing protein, partial [Planktomarina temperata]|nr:Hint domain-containing protein [Planktomarina temperata]
MVVTMDHGPQPIRWIGSSKRRATGNMAPILIRKGALVNTRDLRVSRQHRMLLSGCQAEVLFGESEVLATAKSLVNDHSILREEGGEVEYFHMLFDTHEIVYAEGAPSESFHPGAEGWKALDMPTRNEIRELFPQLANGDFDSYGPSARASLKHKEGSLLSHSMISQTQH